MEYKGWTKIDTANRGTWTVWRRLNDEGNAVFQAVLAGLIPRDGEGRESIETMLGMKGLTRDYI